MLNVFRKEKTSGSRPGTLDGDIGVMAESPCPWRRATAIGRDMNMTG
jgi:hypothetical protein